MVVPAIADRARRALGITKRILRVWRNRKQTGDRATVSSSCPSAAGSRQPSLGRPRIIISPLTCGTVYLEQVGGNITALIGQMFICVPTTRRRPHRLVCLVGEKLLAIPSWSTWSRILADLHASPAPATAFFPVLVPQALVRIIGPNVMPDLRRWGVAVAGSAGIQTLEIAGWRSISSLVRSLFPLEVLSAVPARADRFLLFWG